MKTQRRWQREAASRIEQNPHYAEALSREQLKMSTQGLLAITEVAADLQRGAKVSRAHIDAIHTKVYPGLPRAAIERYAQELNQVGDPNGRLNQFFFRVAGPDAAAYRAVFDDYQGRMMAEQVNDRTAERDQASQARYDAIRAGRTPEANARNDAQVRDQAERRTMIDKMMSANPKYREPTLPEHGNRLDAASKMLFRASALNDPSVSLRDTISYAVDVHSSHDAGKEAGVLPESVGYGDIGAEPPSASSILEGNVSEAA